MIRRTLKMISALILVCIAVLALFLAYCRTTGQTPWGFFGFTTGELADIAIETVKGA